MAEVRVSSEALSGASSQLAAGAESIESELQNLKSLVEGLVGSDWSGAASESFHELFGQWDSSAIQLKDALLGLSELLEQTAQTYEEQESGLAGSFRG